MTGCGKVLLAAALSSGISSAASSRGTVVSDSTPVYSKKSAASPVAATLGQGHQVTLMMSVSDASGCWYEIMWDGQPARRGYVKCNDVEPAADEPTATTSGTTTPRQPDRIDQLLSLAGIPAYIQNVTDPRNLLFLWNTRRIDEGDAQVRQVFEQALRPDTFYAGMRAQFEAHASDDRIPFLIGRLSDPLMRKITLLEERASSPANRAQMVEYGLRAGAPRAARLRLIERIEKATGGVQSVVDTVAAEVVGAAQALNSILPPSKRIPRDQIEAVVAALRSETSSEIAVAVRVTYLYAYSSLTDAELSEYAAFLETDPARWFTRMVRDGGLQAAANFSNDLVTGLARLSTPGRTETITSYPSQTTSRIQPPEALYNQGVSLIDADREAEAIPYLDRAIQARPDYAIAYYKRGNAYRNLGQKAKAIEDYTRAIQYDPSMTFAYINRGVELEELKQMQRAIQDYTLAIQSNPQVAAAWSDRGAAYDQIGQYARAVDDFTHAIQLTPTDGSLYEGRGYAYGHLRQWSRSLQDCQAAIDLGLEIGAPYWCVGTALNWLKDYNRAIPAFNRSLELLPRAGTYMNRAWALEQSGRLDAAMNDYNTAIRLDPREPNGYLYRARLKTRRGDNAGALVDYAAAISVDPRNREAHCERAQLLVSAGRSAEAQSDRAYCPGATR